MQIRSFALFFLSSLLASAQSITIQNPSFETATLPITGNGTTSQLIAGSTITPAGGTLANWTAASTTLNATAGAFDPSSGGVNWTTKWWTGNNLGYLQISAAGTVSLTQSIPTVLQSNTMYTLSALVGRRTYTPRFNYALQLWAGSTMLASASNLTLASNSSGTDTVTYSSGPTNAHAGQPLMVVLSAIGAAGVITEAFFDDISLNAVGGFNVSGVVSATSFGGFSSIAPGGFIEIYGSSLATDSRNWGGADFTGVNAPTSLDGTKVSIGGQQAFVAYISPGQVNALVPSNVPTGLQQVTVTNASGISAPFNVNVNAVEPGLLATPTFLVNGTQYAVAFNVDGTYVMPTGAVAGLASHPAAAGDTIVLYGLGFGPVTPSIPAGQLVQQSNMLATTFQMFIGGNAATAVYSGLAPNYTGLYQFNIVVPTVTSGSAVPLTFALGGVNGTQTLNIAVGN